MGNDVTAGDDLPSVSAVVATRDRPELLREALAAVAAQRYDGVIETVAVFDQAAPDHTLASDDPARPVRVISNQRTAGLAGARNSGILASSGSLVAFCDDDDVWMPGKVAAQVAVLQADPAVQVVVTGMTIQFEDRRIERIWPRDSIRVVDLVRSRVQDAHPSSIAVRRSSLLGEIGLIDEALPGSYGEDRDWLLRAARVHPIAVVREPLVDIAWHPQSFFADRWRTIIDAIEYMVDKHEMLRADRKGLSALRGRQAFAYAALDDRAAARRTALGSLRLNPFDRRAATALVVSSGLISAARAQQLANRMGRGI